jgi:asparaginyl-tRNA synthetase
LEPRVYINKIADFVDKEVTIEGWLYNIRSSGKLMFPELRDGTGVIQGVVVKSAVPESVWEDFSKLTQESSVKVTGTVTKHPKKEGVFELQVNGLEIVHIAEPYPITPKEHGVEFLMDRRHLVDAFAESRRQYSELETRSFRPFRDYMYNNGFILFDTPIFTPNACEGTTTLFSTDYFRSWQSISLTVRAVVCRGRCACSWESLYTWSDIPRGEFYDTKAYNRILDDGT